MNPPSCNFVYDGEKNTAPENILKLFYRISSFHTFNARASTSEHFHTKESRLNVKRNAFSRDGVKIWNGIPQIIFLKKKTEKPFRYIIVDIYLYKVSFFWYLFCLM